MIFGFEGMTDAFRDVNAVSAASRHTPFGRDCVAYPPTRLNAPVCKHPEHKFIKRKNRRFFYSSPIGESIFLDSSMVEHSAVNRVVVGSSPTRGAKEQRSCSSIGIWKGKEAIRLRGQAVKTSPFHGGNTGSIPVGVTKKVILNRI